MPQVSITSAAFGELRERMARYSFPTGILLTGPMAEDCRAPESVEEAWLLEKLYGRAPRWVLDIAPLAELEKQPIDPGESFHIYKVNGISIGVLTSKRLTNSESSYMETRFVYMNSTPNLPIHSRRPQAGACSRG